MFGHLFKNIWKMFSLSSVLSTSAVITTIVSYLSGALECRKFIRNKSTGDSSAFPFICGFLSCSLWLKYGILTDENAVVLVNTVGATLYFSYCIVFWMFTVNSKNIYRQFFGAIIILGLSILYTEWYELNLEEAVEGIGYLCFAVTVTFFAAPFCMLLEVFRRKSTEMLPYPLILMSFCVSIQWFLLGILIEDLFLQVPNFIGCLLSGTQLTLFWIFPNKPKISSVPSGEVPYAIF